MIPIHMHIIMAMKFVMQIIHTKMQTMVMNTDMTTRRMIMIIRMDMTTRRMIMIIRMGMNTRRKTKSTTMITAILTDIHRLMIIQIHTTITNTMTGESAKTAVTNTNTMSTKISMNTNMTITIMNTSMGTPKKMKRGVTSPHGRREP